MEGECRDRSVQTTLSFAVAAVSITTDWIFATLPIFLLWNVQLDWRVKGSVVGMLGLGVLYVPHKFTSPFQFQHQLTRSQCIHRPHCAPEVPHRPQRPNPPH
jgi:hypothetical protein